MRELSQDELDKWKETFAKDGIVYESDDDYKEAVHNLVGYFDTLIQMDLAHKRKNNEIIKAEQEELHEKQ